MTRLASSMRLPSAEMPTCLEIDGPYYHIRVLERAGLVSTAIDAANGRDECRLFIERRQSIAYRPHDASNRTAVLRLVRTMTRMTYRDFAAAFRPGTAIVEGPERNLWASRIRGKLSMSQLALINTLLGELLDVFEAGRRRNATDALYELTFVLAPLVRRASDK